jgi:hypothetical protein
MPAIPLCEPMARGAKIFSVARLFLVINSSDQVRLERGIQSEPIVL